MLAAKRVTPLYPSAPYQKAAPVLRQGEASALPPGTADSGTARAVGRRLAGEKEGNAGHSLFDQLPEQVAPACIWQETSTVRASDPPPFAVLSVTRLVAGRKLGVKM